MGGEEVLRRMRNSRKFDSVQVLVVTSSNAASDRDLVMKLGATDYFRKPSTLEQYLALGPKIRQMLQRDFLSAV
jgi:DNA-binding response OmpR family regulator